MRSRLFRIERAIRCCRLAKRARRGSVSLLVALALPAMVGIAGLAIDVSQWVFYKQRLQSVAGVSAAAGIMIIENGGAVSEALTAASEVAALNGLSGDTQAEDNGTLTITGSGTSLKISVSQSKATVIAGRVVDKSLSRYFLPAGDQWVYAESENMAVPAQ